MTNKEELRIPFYISYGPLYNYVFVGDKRYNYDMREKRYDNWTDSNDPVIKSYQDGFNKIPLEKRMSYLNRIIATFLNKEPDLYVAEWVDKKIKQVEADLLSLDFINEGKEEETTTTELKSQLAKAQKRIAELESGAIQLYNDDEATTIITGKKGQENKRHITAKQVGQIVAEYKWEKGLKKIEMMEMLHRITGLSEGSLKDEIRYKDR